MLFFAQSNEKARKLYCYRADRGMENAKERNGSVVAVVAASIARGDNASSQ